MARAETIGRLHRTQPNGAAVPAPGGQPERVKLPNFGTLQIDVAERRVRAQFRLAPRGSEASYQFDSTEIMSIMNEAGPMDRSRDIRAQAEMDRVREWLARRAQQGGAADYRPAIQI